MATFVLSAFLAAVGAGLLFFAWVASTIGQGKWWLVGALVCFVLAGWGGWEMLS